LKKKIKVLDAIVKAVSFLHHDYLGGIMAKTDSFFIRASVTDDGTTFNQASIDCGAYVDALGKSVLRIHNLSHRWTTAGNATPFPGVAAVGAAQWQLTTQSQGAIVSLTDKSLIASGHLDVQANAASEVVLLSDAVDLSPQHFTKGYLVGVEQIYIGFDQSVATMCDGAEIILECTVETLSSSAAMALALSQQ
jgi:hypothetical protein